MRLPFFYGWVIVAVTFITMAIGVNARTAFSLFFPPIIEEFGWERGVTAGAFSFGFLVSGAVIPQVLLNVPLSTVLLTHGAGLLFLLWYITPRSIFRQNDGPKPQTPVVAAH